MRRRIVLLCFLLVLLAAMSLAGCGNVYLQGEARTAVETSAMDAYLASQKASADAATPAWGKAYLDENFRQCTNWGPKLASEVQAQGQEVAK
ncbi:MAG: hypothetical protein NT031_20700 [Planctomycetota bacterium]|nr:hypothetical protein [Planctomycetota bacterium]